jgi:hypothetical protein
MVVEQNSIIHTIHKYRKYVRTNQLPELYCPKNDGHHLPLIVRFDSGDNVYLYCYTCGYTKRAGTATQDELNARIARV